MKTQASAFLLFSLFLLSGCVQSLNPFYTEEAKVAMPELNGRWTMLDDSGRPRPQKDWLIEDRRILTYSEKGGSGVLEATWFKVNGQLFVDTVAGSPDEQTVSDWWSFHVMPVHILCKVTIQGDQLSFRPLSRDWVKEAAVAGIVSLSVDKGREDDAQLYTPTSEQWMAFLKKHGTNEEAFADSNFRFIRSLERVRTQSP